MSEYSFAGISGFEFERVVGDLLQARDGGIRFQASPPGPDGGIDLRAIGAGGMVTIAQCKHYLGSGVQKLLRTLRRDELPKVQTLAPTRYVLATSVELSPSVKDTIVAMFSPFCYGPEDVLGARDLSALLDEFPEVADRHIKLWLTSEPVLRRVLHAGIFEDTALELDVIQRRLALYVPNESLPRARRILEEHHACVITGIPGIGKTTLARMLLIEYERAGYVVVRIPNHLSQALAATRRGARTIFYFDDFLGQTVLAARERNEDQRLAEFMEAVRAEPAWRLVLTTREYILEQAKLESEAFSRLIWSDRSCVIRLEEDYTIDVRGQILYQHLYFSDLPPEHLIALLRSGVVPKLLRHRNYSPRLVDLLTSRAHTEAGDPEAYPQEFLATFNDPQRLWAVAYRNLDAAAQDLALVVVTMPEPADLEQLQLAYESLRFRRSARLNLSRRPREFEESLRVLDGTLLRSSRTERGTIVVQFHNPSVRDFLESLVEQSWDEAADLTSAAVYCDQVIELFTGRSGSPYPGAVRDPESFLEAVERTLDSPAAHPSPIHVERHTQSLESQALFAYRVWRRLGTPRAEALRLRTFDALADALEHSGRRAPSHLAGFLRGVYGENERSTQEERAFPRRVVERLLAELNWLSDIQVAIEIRDEFPDLFEEEDAARLQEALRDCATSYVERKISPEDYSLYASAASELRSFSEQLAVDLSEEIATIEEYAEEYPSDEDDGDAEAPYTRTSPGPNLNALFDRLEREIQGRQ